MYSLLAPNPNAPWAQRLAAHGRWLPYALLAALLLALLLFGDKAWESNDDVVMDMISQGDGVAAHPSAGLVFSNVIWGWIVLHLPAFGRIDGYQVGTYALLWLACLVLVVSLRRLQAPAWPAAALLFLIFAHAMTRPQFTLVAGYLAVAGLMLFLAWRDAPARWPPLLAATLLVLAGLVRLPELLLVLVVFAPLLLPASRPTLRSTLTSRGLLLAVTVGAALYAAHLVNLRYYAAPDWSAFSALNRLRVPFTDYGLARYFVNHPGALHGAALSQNDVQLLGSWFYQDGQVFTAEHVASLLTGVDWSAVVRMHLGDARQLLILFHDRDFLTLLLLVPVVVLLSLRLSLRTALACITLLGCTLLLYMAGRAGMSRIYMAPLGGILLMLVAAAPSPARLRLQVLGGAGLLCLALLTTTGFLSRLADQSRLEQALCSAAQGRLLVVWGNTGYPFIPLYRPGFAARPACDPALYSLGTMQLAPFATDNLQQYFGTRSLVAALLQGREVQLATNPARIGILQKYFAEHYATALAVDETLNMPHLHLYRLHTGGPARPGANGAADSGADQDEGDNTP